jgi:hypothetical protein
VGLFSEHQKMDALKEIFPPLPGHDPFWGAVGTFTLAACIIVWNYRNGEFEQWWRRSWPYWALFCLAAGAYNIALIYE